VLPDSTDDEERGFLTQLFDKNLTKPSYPQASLLRLSAPLLAQVRSPAHRHRAPCKGLISRAAPERFADAHMRYSAMAQPSWPMGERRALESPEHIAASETLPAALKKSSGLWKRSLRSSVYSTPDGRHQASGPRRRMWSPSIHRPRPTARQSLTALTDRAHTELWRPTLYADVDSVAKGLKRRPLARLW